MMMNDQDYVLPGTPSTKIPLLWDSCTDLHIGIYLCAWSDIQTTNRNVDSIWTYEHEPWACMLAHCFLTYIFFWRWAKLCLHSATLIKYKRLIVIFVFLNGTLSIRRRFLFNSNIQMTLESWEFIVGNSFFPAVFTTLAMFSDLGLSRGHNLKITLEHNVTQKNH